jgi:hypothetical protein
MMTPTMIENRVRAGKHRAARAPLLPETRSDDSGAARVLSSFVVSSENQRSTRL